jgi:hypothetical protein
MSLQFCNCLFNCGTEAEILGNLMLVSAEVANFPSSVNPLTFDCLLKEMQEIS